MVDIFNYRPRASHEVHVGQRPLGGDQPLRLQSMTTRATTDTMGCADQIERIVAAGADYVRLTTQGTLEAENLRQIRAELQRRGIDVPLVADVHFNPHVADVAATIVEKVRINPGNYVDPARTFKQLEYTDEEYAEELQRLETRFKSLLAICREHGTALRIGVNHGSLSDRIMCRYGDTPEGIVESCMEFLRVCMKEHFMDVVVSIKASNTVVMVCAVRQLCAAMEREGMDFPLHLGVTEAGEGEDGRIKSALGIGALLNDGIGDTLRVSLSEEPEVEIPVAYKLAGYVTSTRGGHPQIPATAAPDFDYLHPQRRPTHAVGNIGGTQPPVVVAAAADFSDAVTPDYVFCRGALPPAPRRRDGIDYIVGQAYWKGQPHTYPFFTVDELPLMGACPAEKKFLPLLYVQLNEEVKACLRQHPEVVVIAFPHHPNVTGELRAVAHELWREGLTHPLIMAAGYPLDDSRREEFQLFAAADMGGVLIDGLADGLLLFSMPPTPDTPLRGRLLGADVTVSTAFALLQAARQRISKTEYISCPGCGRTLYDLQGTIARIKAATAHLTGLKIAIMGCIVNGPGEMADADYGYVGAARGKVSLYRGRTCVEKNIPAEEAVDRLLALIEADKTVKE
jgi:(E)-4-hydroxy-3-methylbut-2-enyl-diphosphate synthase